MTELPKIAGNKRIILLLFDKKRTFLLVKSSVDKLSEIAYHSADNRQKGFFHECVIVLLILFRKGKDTK